MAAELDPRLLRVGIEIADGQIKWYAGTSADSGPGFAITASGTKYANPIQNEAEVKISNIAKETRDYILTETSPFNTNPFAKKIYIEAGRVSTGYSAVFEGNIVSSCGTQPPDIDVTIKAKTGNFYKGDIVARSKSKTNLSTIAQGVASDLGLRLDFQASDKQISNYTHNGASLKQVDKLGSTGAVDAYINNGTLVVKDLNIPLKGTTRVLNLDTGMVGIPEFTEQGIKVKMLFDNQTDIGYGLDVQSVMLPAANGIYSVFKMGFELASRDTPFYLIAEAVGNFGNVHAPTAKVSVKKVK